MTDSMIERVARILEPQAWAARGVGDTLAYKNRRTSSLRKASAAIKIAALEQMIIDAYVRGVEWNEENPLDREYRFKAAGDYADKALSQAQPTGEKT